MKNCCKVQANWKHDGAREKRVVDHGQFLKITQQNYLTCRECGRKLAMFVEKQVFEANRQGKVILERA